MRTRRWPHAVCQFREAKARLSDAIRRATRGRPRRVGISAETTAPIIPEKHHAQLTSAGASIVDHILVGEPWSDELVDAANDRRFDSGRAIDF